MVNLFLKAAAHGVKAISKNMEKKKEASLIDLFNTANELYKQNDYASAIYYYQQSVPYISNKISDIVQVYYDMSFCYYKLSQYGDALKLLEQIVNGDALNSKSKKFRSTVYSFTSMNFYMVGDMNQAVRNIKRALRVDKNNTLKLADSNAVIRTILNSPEFNASKRADTTKKVILIAILIAAVVAFALNYKYIFS